MARKTKNKQKNKITVIKLKGLGKKVRGYTRKDGTKVKNYNRSLNVSISLN